MRAYALSDYPLKKIYTSNLVKAPKQFVKPIWLYDPAVDITSDSLCKYSKALRSKQVTVINPVA